jgi:hypothetical protein
MKASSWRGATKPAHRQATLKLFASSSFRTKTTDEEELLSNMGRKRMRDPKEVRHANRSEKSSFKPVESDQFQIGPRILCDLLKALFPSEAFSAVYSIFQMGMLLAVSLAANVLAERLEILKARAKSKAMSSETVLHRPPDWIPLQRNIGL